MPVIDTGLTLKGVRSEFFNRFNASKTYFQDWSTRIASTTDAERYRWLGTVPQMREWGQGRLAKGLRGEAYNVDNLKYEATLEVDRDEVSDDQTGQIMVRAAELGQRAATHKDYLLGLLMDNGGTAGYNSYDGVAFFTVSHSSGSSGWQSNAVVVDTAGDATTITTGEMATGIQNGIAALMAFKDDQGFPMALNQDSITVVVPPDYYWRAAEALGANIIQNTSNIMQGVAQLAVFPFLTAPTTADGYIYILKTDGVVRPFIFQDREPITFSAIDQPDSEEVFMREKMYYGVRARYRMTYGYWQYAVRVNFT